jgi:hypothetical protein
MLSLGACANTADPSPPYDEAARILGAEVATANGGSLAAIADITTIAYGSMPDGFFRSAWGHVRGAHDGLEYVYVVWCRDSNGRAMTCGETTASAHAIAGWGGSNGSLSVWHQGIWDLQGLHGGLALASGTSWGSYESDGWLYVKGETQLVMDFGVAAPLGGAVQATIDVLDPDGNVTTTLDGDVVFDRPARPALRIDDLHYWLDIETGEVRAAVVLE